jgi:hypothetical protein
LPDTAKIVYVGEVFVIGDIGKVIEGETAGEPWGIYEQNEQPNADWENPPLVLPNLHIFFTPNKKPLPREGPFTIMTSDSARELAQKTI